MRTKDGFRDMARLLRARHAADVHTSFLSGLLQFAAFRQAHAVAMFLPFGTEPQTRDLIDACYAHGKQVGVPAWEVEMQAYRFCALAPDIPLAPGHMRIPEPITKRWVPTDTYALFLIPGLLFDVHGTRIGYGKGFYDRLLINRADSATLAALAFDWQIVEETLPHEAHDVPMDAILTPTRTFYCRAT